ncbi:LOW QUALITY PROTEIN: androgen-binding protein homolog [Globicephala melas]|uniref:LOW QUALITY PROTEIN: androgen-binding protein homolog n=1 Tax=Tursiops truncatus TaxID=9739 RepID=A0A2U4BTV8_TURTR|nr:LOW QUALITY PROTEIN: androgen-binding protein homolog [Tursiops truncatus]XP_030730701.1 LOW QUALITY PROTEIN: androgen-binding protein homolog [Globicephala melas]
MKGTLLVLALLVTRELTFETAEACPIFYRVVSTVVLGSRTLLDLALETVGTTEREKADIEKLQDCYNELGFLDKLKPLKLMVIYSPHPPP